MRMYMRTDSHVHEHVHGHVHVHGTRMCIQINGGSGSCRRAYLADIFLLFGKLQYCWIEISWKIAPGPCFVLLTENRKSYNLLTTICL